MNEDDYKEMNEKTWNDYEDNKISPDELDKQLDDNREEYDKYGY